MIKQLLHLLLPLSLFIILSIFGGCHSNPFRVTNISREPAQDIESALNYLDLRNKDWLKGIHENNGSCLSCHTTLSYSLVRPSFGQSEELTRMREMIEKRVEIYSQGGLIGNGANQMWYPETIQESLSNEAVLNAVTLVYMDKGKEKGTEKLKSSTKKALDLMWKRQEVAGDLKGGFKWLDYFGLRPFEAKGAGYWGAAMVAVAVGEAPENYKNNPAIQENLNELKKYLKTNLANETLHNQLMVVWANQALDGTIISQAKVKEIGKAVGAGTTDGVLLAMATLMMQDEMNEAKSGNFGGVTQAVSGETSADAEEQVRQAIDAIADYVETVAERIEKN